MSKAKDRMNIGVVSHIRDLLHVEKFTDVVGFLPFYAPISASLSLILMQKGSKKIKNYIPKSWFTN